MLLEATADLPLHSESADGTLAASELRGVIRSVLQEDANICVRPRSLLVEKNTVVIPLSSSKTAKLIL